ncbi:M23 family metallopeptidase [Terasakiella sp. A23]|uniref:M23 family metallopeptidase n=1 Tax=Terasakiella sp. FCG-A23 TaxID=3080561 RepID=UPI002954A408|nr:M23 family metallopeptidase [Terasakiella sp. A23]MDV7338755.1 M23 family metallopeptidase [Terasakiella sp. A23]
MMLRWKYIALSMAVCLTLSSCGWVEVPSNGGSYSRSPSAKASKPTSTGARVIPGTIIVQKGDTVYGVARRTGASVRDIIDTNNLKAPFHLKAGQRLRLPQSPFHIVREGDTLYSVSRGYNTDVYNLAKINNLKSPFTLIPGQKLKLPRMTNLASRTTDLKPAARVAATPQSKPIKVTKAAPRISKKAIPKPPPRSSSRFSWPTQGKLISGFGAKKDGLRNDGINIAAKRGTPVKAAENGVVAYSGNELRGFGNMILLKHSGGWITAYAHTDKILVKRGQKIKKGQLIARVGSSGGVTTPQLHFEIRKGMNPVNPKKYLGG